jgi:hypothetical protein
MILMQLEGQIYLIKSKCKDQLYMTFIRKTGSIVTTPAGMLCGDNLATSAPVSY